MQWGKFRNAGLGNTRFSLKNEEWTESARSGPNRSILVSIFGKMDRLIFGTRIFGEIWGVRSKRVNGEE